MPDSARRKKLRDIIIPINFRPILFIALSIAFGMVLFKYSPSLKVWTIVIPIACYGAIFGILSLFMEKDGRRNALFTLLLCLAFLLLGMFSLGNELKTVKESQLENGVYTIRGEVYECSYNEGLYNLTLTECKYNGESGGNLCIYGVSTEVDLYDIIEVKCYTYKTDEIKSGAISSYFLNNQSMRAGEIYELTVIGKKDGVASSFKTVTDSVFFNALGNYGGVLSALIRGDTSEMKETVNPFRFVGIAHIFAVSGMHVGLLFVALNSLFKRIKLNKKLRAVIICAILFFYSYLCGLSPSSFRAAIMCSCLAISQCIGEKYDGINALSVAFILITLIFPTDIFSIGFILSFVVCFSIIVLAPPIKRILSFMPEKFAESIATLLASQLAALPIMVSSFGYFSFISVVANLMLLPIVTIIYYFTVIGLIICLIIPINQLIALFIPKLLTLGTITVTNFLSKFIAQIRVFPWIFSYLYYTMLTVSSDFINCSRKLKISCATGCAIVLITTTVLTFVI